MEVIMNGKTVQYSMDFRKQHPDIFKVLLDENHQIYFVENQKYDDFIIFASPKKKMIALIAMSDFEEGLRRLNRRLFFNISVIFNEILESEEDDITGCKLVSKDEFLSGLKTDYIFEEINILRRKREYIIYIPPESDIGTKYDYAALVAAQNFRKKLKSFNILPEEKIFVDVYKDELVVINPYLGTLKEISTSEITEKHHLNQFERISQPWDNFVICDARELYKICGGQDLELDNCILYIKDRVLYVCFIKEPEKFENLAAVSKYLYNNMNKQLYKKIQDELGCTDLIYLANEHGGDCIIYKSGKAYKYRTLKSLKFKENLSDVKSAFKDKLNVSDFGSTYILNIRVGAIKDIPEDYVETDTYCCWLSYFDKTLYIAEKTEKQA